VRLSTLMLALLLACSPSRDIEKEAAWRDVPLRSAPSQVTGLELIRAEPALGEAVYSRTGEEPRWGKAKIAVRYHFFDEALWKVEVTTGDSLALLDAIKAEYGTPPFDKPWNWEGESVRMHFQGHEHDSAAVVTIVDKALEKKREAARPERLQKKRAADKAAAKKAEAERKAAQTDDTEDTDAE